MVTTPQLRLLARTTTIWQYMPTFYYARCRGPPPTAVPAAETFSTQAGLTLHRNSCQPDARNETGTAPFFPILRASNLWTKGDTELATTIYAGSAEKPNTTASVVFQTSSTAAAVGTVGRGSASTRVAAKTITRTDSEEALPAGASSEEVTVG
ncbi:hypothetical protein J6590_102232 [Homalodisca vitripennis]|nr:hypothetical protein J6590_102232 [Homalodisca vitripennis]